MRFGCCTNMVSANEDGTGIEVIERLKEVGYDYIELPLAQIMELNNKQFYRLHNTVKNSGLKCEACNNFFPASIKLTGDEVNIESILDYTSEALYKAKALGADIVVFGSGAARMVPPGFPTEKAWEQLISLLSLINNIASKTGITIAVEHLRKAECNIVNTVDEGLMLVNKVNCNSIKLLVDFFHMIIEKEDPIVLSKAGDRIKHVHFAMTEKRVFPKQIYYDDICKSFINNLKKINYDGRLSVEAYTKDIFQDFAEALCFLKSCFN